MTFQISAAAATAMADQYETTVGTAAVLKIFSGAQPANCAAANSGTELASMTLPSDWLGAASSGVKSLAGSWADSSANATGTAGHFRIYASDGTTCHGQGSVTATSGGGDIELASTSVTSGQPVTITAFTLTMPITE